MIGSIYLAGGRRAASSFRNFDSQHLESESFKLSHSFYRDADRAMHGCEL